MTSENFSVSRPARRERAAALLAEDALSDVAIAAEVGITPRQLASWKHDPAFAALLDANRARLQAEAMRYPIARKRNRMRRLNQRWEKGHQVIDERGADTSMAEVPGGTTGLLVERWKMVGTGDDAELVREYAVDTGLLKELRDMEKQAAIEAGEWETRTSDSLPDGSYVRRIVIEETRYGDGSASDAPEPLDAGGGDVTFSLPPRTG